MEKTGSPEYISRRVKHWFRKNWTSLEPTIRIFDEVENLLKQRILDKTKSSKFPILFFYKQPEHWCLVDLHNFYYQFDDEYYDFDLVKIISIGNTWGRTTLEEQITLEHKVKQSSWIYLNTLGAEQYDLYFGAKSGSCIWNCVRRIKQLKVAYKYDDYVLNYG